MLPQRILGIFYMYGLMIAVGILACFGLLFWYGKRKKLESRFIDFVFYLAIAAIALGFGSAALFQAIYNYIETPSAGFHFDGGITFIGGLIGGAGTFLILYFIFRKRYKHSLVDIISFVPCCILVAHAFGRVGCFFAGCCYGKPTDSFLGVRFAPHSPAASHYPGINGYSVPLHPTQLYEAAFLFALLAVCLFLVVKKDFKHNMSLYLITYGIFRFCIEFLRDDSRGKLFGSISPSQFWSIGMVGLGIGVYFLLEWAYKKRAAELAAEAKASPEAPKEQEQTAEVEK